MYSPTARDYAAIFTVVLGHLTIVLVLVYAIVFGLKYSSRRSTNRPEKGESA